jgi:hypothetical protein
MTHEFALVIAGSPDIEAIGDAVFEATEGDCSLGRFGGETVIDFSREAPSFGEAVAEAIREVMRAGLAVSMIRTAEEPQPA